MKGFSPHTIWMTVHSLEYIKTLLNNTCSMPHYKIIKIDIHEVLTAQVWTSIYKVIVINILRNPVFCHVELPLDLIDQYSLFWGLF